MSAHYSAIATVLKNRFGIFQNKMLFLMLGKIDHCVVVLICISLITTDIKHLFICLLAIWILSFMKYLFKFLPIFKLDCLCF